MKKNNKSISYASKVWQKPFYFIAFGFGSGLMPIAPGTWGTLVAIPLYWLLSFCSLDVYLGTVVLAFILGVYITDQVSKDMGVHDFGGIVWDEIVGYLLTMLLMPFSLLWALVGFGLFRLFDIWKPFPIRYMDERIQGGLGIMLDDVLAAIYAWIVMQGLYHGLPLLLRG
jgi:phosphatidylglycerophosphatase A